MIDPITLKQFQTYYGLHSEHLKVANWLREKHPKILAEIRKEFKK